MKKLQIRGKDLRKIGYPEGPVISIAMAVMEKNFKYLSLEDALEVLRAVLQSPNQYAEDAVLGKIAEALLPKPAAEGAEISLNQAGISFNVFGSEYIEQGALHQMYTAAKLPVSVAGALMPDAHSGYGLPIGGVLATENAVIPYGVGVDIGCFTGETKVKLADGRALSFLDLFEEDQMGKENFTFSLDKNYNVVISKIQAPRQTRVVDKLLEITLDNGAKYSCTTDHIHYLRTGEEVEAKDLKINDSLMPLYLEFGANIPIERKSYKDKKFKLGQYYVVYNPNIQLYDYVHFLADDYNLKNSVYDKTKGKIRHHKDFNKYNNNPTNLERVDFKEHFKIHAAHAKSNNEKGISGFKKAREKNPEFFARMGSENMTKNHRNPEFARRRDKRAAETFSKYNQTDEFYRMTRKAGQRGKAYLIAKNQSEEGRRKSKEVSQKKYQCPYCDEIVVGGFGIYNHSRKNKSCSVENGNYKLFKEVKNHRITDLKLIDCPNTPVYCLSVNEYENFALDAGVFVHNCRMCLSVFDINPKELVQREHYFARELNEATLFGSGAQFDRAADHEVMYRKEFDELRLLKGLQGRAWKQLGSSGSGNHFAEFGIVEITEPDLVLGLAAGNYLGLLTHSGSRGLGASIANHYTKLAKQKRRLAGDAQNLAWLALDEEAGAEYWMAMNLAGDYASACHHVIHDKIARQLGRQPLQRVENHHNFCIPSTEKVPTPQGYKYINELKKGDIIYCFDEKSGLKTTKIVDVWHSGRKLVFEIETKHRKIRVSGDHPIMVLETRIEPHPIRKWLTKSVGAYVWKEACQVKEGDIVICADGYYDKDTKSNSALARFIGAYLGDGWVKSKKNNGYYFGLAIGDKEESHTEKYLKLMEQLPLVRTEKATWKAKKLFLKNNTKGNYGISGCDKDFYCFIESLGLAEASTKRRVPPLVFSFSNEDKIEFLSGYMDADGSIGSRTNGDGSGLIRACNKRLVEDLREIAIGCGLFVSNIKIKNRETNFGKAVVYAFNISPSGMAKLNLWHCSKSQNIYHPKVNRTGLHNRKLGYIDLPHNTFAEKVLRIKVGSILEDVWDLEVLDSSHSFICEGIVVHNCWREVHNNKELYVHRKGATPAGKDILGIIPGSMASPGFVVKGKGVEASLSSASHGAGRVMSRTAALNSVTHKALNELLEKQGVKLIGGGLDEAPFAYKDIHAVMAAQKMLVEVVGAFHPKIVRMDGTVAKGWRKKNVLEGE